MSDDLRLKIATVSTMILARSAFNAMPSPGCFAVLVGLMTLQPVAGFAQDAPAPEATPPVANGSENEDADTDADGVEENVDPRTKAAQEQVRQLRIRRLTDITSTLPTEGDLLTSFTVPEGLVGDRGLRYGRLIVLPALTLGAAYTDNAGASEDDRVEELSVNAASTVRAQSQLKRHAFGVDASATTSHSFRDSNDDYLDWLVGADGRLDLTRRSSVFGQISYNLDTEDDSSAEAEGNANDVHSIDGSTGYQFRGNKFNYRLDLSAFREEFSGEGSADRDNTTYGIDQFLEHRTTERLTLFVAPQYAYTTFDEETDDDGEGRDTHSATGLVGGDLAFRVPINVSAAIGYTRLFEESGQDTDSVVANAALAWQATPLTSLNLFASHALELTTLEGADASTLSTLGIGVNRQIGTSTTLASEITTTYTDFRGLARNDYDLSATLGLARRLTDHLFLSLAYRFEQRFSTDDDVEEFNTNSVVLGLSAIY